MSSTPTTSITVRILSAARWLRVLDLIKGAIEKHCHTVCTELRSRLWRICFALNSPLSGAGKETPRSDPRISNGRNPSWYLR